MVGINNVTAINVSQITEITFQPFKHFLLVGQTKQLTFELVPENYSISVIEFVSSDTNIVTIDEEEGLYSLYISLKAADVNNTSFYYNVDNLGWWVIVAPDTVWGEETKFFSHSFTGIVEYAFLVGEHTVELAYRQPGVKLDFILK